MIWALVRREVVGGILFAVVTSVLPIRSALAQSAEAFYKGRTLQINVGFGVGASYDTYTRVLADHIGRYIPGNPRIIVVNGSAAAAPRHWFTMQHPRRHRDRHAAAPPIAALIGTQGGKFRPDPVQLDRQRQQRSQHLRRGIRRR